MVLGRWCCKSILSCKEVKFNGSLGIYIVSWLVLLTKHLMVARQVHCGCKL